MLFDRTAARPRFALFHSAMTLVAAPAVRTKATNMRVRARCGEKTATALARIDAAPISSAACTRKRGGMSALRCGRKRALQLSGESAWALGPTSLRNLLSSPFTEKSEEKCCCRPSRAACSAARSCASSIPAVCSISGRSKRLPRGARLCCNERDALSAANSGTPGHHLMSAAGKGQARQRQAPVTAGRHRLQVASHRCWSAPFFLGSAASLPVLHHSQNLNFRMGLAATSAVSSPRFCLPAPCRQDSPSPHPFLGARARREETCVRSWSYCITLANGSGAGMMRLNTHRLAACSLDRSRQGGQRPVAGYT